MASTSGDYQLAAAAAGFTLGFGCLTVWKAVRQTKANKSPLRSAYIYMLWGEIIANLVIGIIGWLFLNEVLGATALVLFFILFCYVFEVQLLLQIIINRTAIFTERKTTAARLKWGTAILITSINIVVFCIWIPAHMVPTPSQKFVEINKYWDRISKVLICLVDAGLNWYFIHVVSARLVKYHGLKKYKSLVVYYTRLGVVSVFMDIMLIGLMSLPNQVVYIQFHPIAYMVKLNIEMSMADLIVKTARGSEIDVHEDSSAKKPFPFPDPTKSSSRNPGTMVGTMNGTMNGTIPGHDYVGGAQNIATAGHTPGSHLDRGREAEQKGITRQTEIQVYSNDSDSESSRSNSKNPIQEEEEEEPGHSLDRTPSRQSHGSQIPLKDLPPRTQYSIV